MAGRLDWDREERERRARKNGREAFWRALSSGLEATKSHWRTEAPLDVWVQPVLSRKALAVFLPPRSWWDPDADWRINYSDERREDVRSLDCLRPHVSVFENIGRHWYIEVWLCSGESEDLEGEYDDYSPEAIFKELR